MSIPRRLGRLARGIALSAQEEDRRRVEEVLRNGRERTENLRNAFRAGYETWKTAEEERRRREEEEQAARQRQERREDTGRRSQGRGEGNGRPYFRPRKYPPEVARAYQRLGLELGSPLADVRARRRELIKRHHPDRFSDPDKRLRAERLASEINASHDVIVRHLGA